MQKQIEANKEDLENYLNLQDDHKAQQQKAQDDQQRLLALEGENEAIRNQASQLLAQAKKEQAEREFLVDRRMITQYLITFMQKQHDRSTQLAMMQAMSKILQFTEEEKRSLGLATPAPSTQQRGFGHSLMSYMMNGDDDD